MHTCLCPPVRTCELAKLLICRTGSCRFISRVAYSNKPKPEINFMSLRFGSAALDNAATVHPPNMNNVVTPRLSVENLTIMAGTKAFRHPVVSNLSFQLGEGEILALAGESGSGKSLTSLAIMGLLPKPATRLTSGVIRLGSEEISQYSERRMRHIRGNRVAMIFQEPMTSLNPILTIGTQLIESITAH